MRQHHRGLAGALILALAVVLGAGCTLVVNSGTDNGPVRTEQRTVSGFTQVSVGAGAELTITIGSAFAVEITAEDRVLAKLRSRVEGERLVIDATSGYSTTKGVQIRISMPELTGLELSGGARGTVSTVDSAALDLVLSGGAQATIEGTASTLRLEASGGSQAHLRGLSAGSAQVDASGGSRAELTATDAVSGTASGGSTVDVWGGASLSVETSGGAETRSH